MDATIRPYEKSDADALWDLKRAFERGLGSTTGDEDKQATYDAKLTGEYRSRYLSWVHRCVDEDPACITLAEVKTETIGRATAGEKTEATRRATPGDVVGYAFVLPASLSFIWDAAVLNELYLVPDARGTGVADELMAAAIDTARTQDLPLDRLVLDVDRKNERARAFYDRHGFEHWGEMVARSL